MDGVKVQRSCNCRDGRYFVVILRIDSLCPSEDVESWVLSRLTPCTHTAAFDTYGRTRSAWHVLCLREDGDEFRVLIDLQWNGRRQLDMEALVFWEKTSRAPPLMNSAEILELIAPKDSTTSSTFGGLEAVGVSAVTKKIIDELWKSAIDDGLGNRYHLMRPSNANPFWKKIPHLRE